MTIVFHLEHNLNKGIKRFLCMQGKIRSHMVGQLINAAMVCTGISWQKVLDTAVIIGNLLVDNRPRKVSVLF